ncbi:MAG: 30S ribosomal protein S4 [Candidatus Pacebacteria bacterium]|nr:30S ribosomal protein S4 [Candidatus Paceibacterota bacterium]
MARDLSAKCKKCRREGKKIFLKGERCFSMKCAMIKRPYAPGQHGQSRRMGLSEYGIQLREKQKVKRTYGLLEKQFRKYYDMANSMKGNTGVLLSTLLERRMDNVVYRLGLAESRNHARQLVNHGHFLLNGIKTDIPSCLLKEGDVISIKNDKGVYFQNLKNVLKNQQVPSWLSLDLQKIEGKVVSSPTLDEIDMNSNIHLIIEFYSKS